MGEKGEVGAGEAPVIAAEHLARARPDSTANYEAATSVWSRFRGGAALGPSAGFDSGGGVDDDDDDQMGDDDFEFEGQPAPAWRAGDRWTLIDASFAVRPGEALGLIGSPETGAETALQILGGSIQPDRGRAVILGRSTRTSDFNFNFAPKTASYANQAKAMAIAARVPRRDRKRWIAELLRFALFHADGTLVDADDKTLTRRLATAASVDPTADVLLIDDIGLFDTAFRDACVHRARAALQRGAAAVVRSKKPLPVIELCTRAVRFEEGVVVEEGDPRRLLEAEHRRRLTASRSRGIQAHVPGFNGQCAILAGRVTPRRQGHASISVELETAQPRLTLDPQIVLRSVEGRSRYVLRHGDRFPCEASGRYRLSVVATLPDDTPQLEVGVVLDVFNHLGGYSQLRRNTIGEIPAAAEAPQIEGGDVGGEVDYEELELSAEWSFEAEED